MQISTIKNIIIGAGSVLQLFPMPPSNRTRKLYKAYPSIEEALYNDWMKIAYDLRQIFDNETKTLQEEKDPSSA